MNRRIVALILSTTLCFTTLISCTNNNKTEPENTTNNTTTQQESNETLPIEENYPTTPLFDNVFESFSKKIGKSSLTEDKAIVDSLTDYSVEITEPDEYTMGNIKINDGNGDYVSLMYFPETEIETLTLVSYNRNGYSISISNELHELTTPKYTTYDINATEKNKNVPGINELKKFIFVDIGDGKSQTSDKIEVFVNVKEIINDGKVSFEIDTNLPNETSLMVSLSNGSYNASTKISIENGKATTESFSKQGNPLDKGEYTVDITMPVVNLQSNAVRSIIGNTGENLTGDLVEKSIIGDSNTVSKEVTFTIQ